MTALRTSSSASSRHTELQAWVERAHNALNDLENMRPERLQFDSDEAYLTAWRWYRDNVMVIQRELEIMREHAAAEIGNERFSEHTELIAEEERP